LLLFHSKKSNQNSCQNKLPPVKQYFDSHRHRDGKWANRKLTNTKANKYPKN